MTTKTKTRINKLMIVALCALMLAACSGNSKGNNGNNESSSSSPASSQTTPAGDTSAATQSDSRDSSVAFEGASFDAEDLNAAWSVEDATTISLDGATIAVAGEGAQAQDSIVTITAGGLYVVQGSLDDGQLIVDAAKEEIVRIVLNDADLSSSTSAPFYIKEAGKVIVTLADGSVNQLLDATSYSYPDADTDEPSATLYSKADLVFNGNGSLTVTGNYLDAINGRDDVKFISGTYVIQAADDAIVGKDRVEIADGQFTITAVGDGIKSSNDTDADKGYIAINAGSFSIRAGNDAFQAETTLSIEAGTFELQTGGGAEQAPARSAQQDGFGNDWGGQTGRTAGQRQQSETEEESQTSDSMKALKAGVQLVVNGGTFTIDAADDALHSNGSVYISDGRFTIATGDDAIHADGMVTVSGGTIDISRSYEGIEGSEIVISGGEVHIVASDDGINAAGNNGLNNYLRVSGGNIYVNAQGDGLDANGNIEMSGGTLVVSGPSGNGNGALDYDGEFLISGGSLIAAGSSGMAMATSESSEQPTISMSFSSVQQVGTQVTLLDADGQELASYTSEKTFQSIVFSNPELQQGQSYTIAVNGETLVTFELGSSVQWVNESGTTEGSMQQGFGGRGPQGGNNSMPGPGREGGGMGGMQRPMEGGALGEANTAPAPAQ